MGLYRAESWRKEDLGGRGRWGWTRFAAGSCTAEVACLLIWPK